MGVTKILMTTNKMISSYAVLLCIFFVVLSNSNYSPIGKVRKGFHCNDTSISHTYHGDSISAGILFLTLLGGAWIVVYVTEMLCRERDDQKPPKPTPFSVGVKTFYAGFVYVLAFTEVLKVLVSELRPHFLYSCQPDFDRINCSMGLVTNYRCTGSGPSWLVDRDIYKSFPSGHASLSFFTFVFLSAYVLGRPLRIQRTPSFLWKALVVFVFFAWACTCAVSRHVDHRHFWWDIIAGAFIGVIGGVIQINLLLSRHNFKQPGGKSS